MNDLATQSKLAGLGQVLDETSARWLDARARGVVNRALDLALDQAIERYADALAAALKD